MHALDIIINSYVASHMSVGLIQWAEALSRIFDMGPYTVLALCALFCIYQIRGARYAWLFASTTLSGAMLVYVLKPLFSIARPSGGLVEAFGQSFPSGHSVMATIFFLLLVFIFDDYFSGWKRVVFITVCILGIFLVGASRVYLGVHWTSDVVGGIVLGALFVYFTTELFEGLT